MACSAILVLDLKGRVLLARDYRCAPCRRSPAVPCRTEENPPSRFRNVPCGRGLSAAQACDFIHWLKHSLL